MLIHMVCFNISFMYIVLGIRLHSYYFREVHKNLEYTKGIGESGALVVIFMHFAGRVKAFSSKKQKRKTYSSICKD